ERRLSHQSAENIHKHSHTLSLSLSLSFSFGYLCLRCSHQSLTSRGRPDHHTPVNSPGSRPGYTHTHTHTHTHNTPIAHTYIERHTHTHTRWFILGSQPCVQATEAI